MVTIIIYYQIYYFNLFNFVNSFIVKNKIKSYDEYISIYNIGCFPYCPYDYYKDFGFTESIWFKIQIKILFYKFKF